METTPQSGVFQPSGIDSGQNRMLLGGGDAPSISRAGWNPCVSLTPEQMRYNVQQICTLLEGIGTCCLVRFLHTCCCEVFLYIVFDRVCAGA